MTAPASGVAGEPAPVPVDPGLHADTIWRLARARDRAALGREETTWAWIVGRLTAPGLDPPRDARLLPGPDGEPVGAVWVSGTSGVAGWNAELVLGPRATEADGVRLLSFAEHRCRELLTERPGDPGQSVHATQAPEVPEAPEAELSCFVSEGEHTARAALHTRGFGSPHPYHRMAVTLDDGLPPAEPVPGAAARPLRDERDLRLFHAVKNRAYSAEEAGKQEDEFTTWVRAWQAAPGVDPAQCALLEADGAVVGFANITDRMLESRRAAYVQQIGIVPEARKRGLGQLLLSWVMDAARRRGRTAMVLTVDTENSPALALYRRLGWQVESRFDDFRRTVAPLDHHRI
ncbi:N-acetyltransferase family protein [Streptomyces sp. NPDC002851]